MVDDFVCLSLFNKNKGLLEKQLIHSHLIDSLPELDRKEERLSLLRTNLLSTDPKRDIPATRQFIRRIFVLFNPQSDKISFSHWICVNRQATSTVVFLKSEESRLSFRLRKIFDLDSRLFQTTFFN
jgi:hypothetical protein